MAEQKVSKFGQAFISYGSYHYNPVNKWIHIVCVPVIAATLISALSFVPVGVEVLGNRIGVAEVAVAASLIYYASININFAMGMALLQAALTLLWQKIFAGMDQDAFFFWVVTTHIVAWVLQFVGHGVFEKRKPALFDNISQILNAPLFVIVEIFDLVGIRSSEVAGWMQQIKSNVEALRKKDQ